MNDVTRNGSIFVVDTPPSGNTITATHTAPAPKEF